MAHHILVIDDDAAMRSMVVDFVGSEGHIASEASLASQALGQIANGEHEPDLIICDLNMPEMTGLEFISKAREILPHVPIILITAFGSIETAIEAVRKGAFDYMTKPFKLAEMSVTI